MSLIGSGGCGMSRGVRCRIGAPEAITRGWCRDVTRGHSDSPAGTPGAQESLGSVVSVGELALIDAYRRAANYLSVGQI